MKIIGKKMKMTQLWKSEISVPVTGVKLNEGTTADELKEGGHGEGDRHEQGPGLSRRGEAPRFPRRSEKPRPKGQTPGAGFERPHGASADH